jgi:hypothetical protein
VSDATRSPWRLRAALALAFLGTLVCLVLFAWHSPYTLVAFMFLGQPLLLLAFALFAWEARQDLRRKGVL